MEWQASKRSGVGRNADYRISGNYGSWQDEQHTSFGSDGFLFLPQWEQNHDQTDGVRIGEARKPGQTSAEQKAGEDLDGAHSQYHRVELIWPRVGDP
eukprot:10469270-Heterocapsa_arctica.AAC.1